MEKVVLITGSSRGIGAAAIEYFAKNDFNVVINYLNSKKEAEFLKTKIEREYNVKALLVKADVSNESEVKVMVETIIKEFGRIDTLVNNAGIVFDKDFNDRTVEDFRKTFDVNVIGTFLVSKYVAPHMLKQGDGNIVIASSTSGTYNFNTTSIDYDCSKAALIALTKNLAKEFAPYIRVNATALGWADTDMNKELPEDYLENEKSRILLNRFATLEEVAKLYYYLGTEESSYINGQVITIDGGTI